MTTISVAGKHTVGTEGSVMHCIDILHNVAAFQHSMCILGNGLLGNGVGPFFL